ncbi:GNAT family N-acetyltransferase [Silvanigrella sp.]|jgi:ribosomal-protein-alanine N-acetyltransferase|uniref:GNAT family N-acetyltransferase n=1 Tax=Silvanigrella sp. TaxID=2024976 RepID=UPI0037C6769E
MNPRRKIIKKEILFIWKGEFFKFNLNDANSAILKISKMEYDSYFKDTFLSKEMNRISKDDKYASTLNSLEEFCSKSFLQTANEHFSSFFICFYDNIFVAYLNVNIIFDIAEIDYICVDKNYLRKSISFQLISLFETLCKQENFSKINKIMLEVGALNEPALNLYHKLGYRKISERKNYYKSKEDAFIMEKIL